MLRRRLGAKLYFCLSEKALALEILWLACVFVRVEREIGGMNALSCRGGSVVCLCSLLEAGGPHVFYIRRVVRHVGTNSERKIPRRALNFVFD